MPVYQPNIPTGQVQLDQDYLNIQGNFQQANIAYGQDHVPYSDTTGLLPTGISGMHKAVHLLPVSTVASNAPKNQPVNGYTATTKGGQIFGAQINDDISTDTALYHLTANGLLQQLTSNFAPVILSNGYTFLPGGLILQWGVKDTTSSSGTLTFLTEGNIAFPHNIFIVSLTPKYNSSIGTPNGAASYTVDNNATKFLKTSFDWTRFTSSGSYRGFYWIALGN